MPHFLHGGYVDDKPSQVNIESVNDSTAYCISKTKLEALFAHSIEMANFGRKIFEREILSVDASTLAYGTPPTAKERYLTLMEENPELLQDVPLKYLASYLYITPQSLSRIRAGLREKRMCQNKKTPAVCSFIKQKLHGFHRKRIKQICEIRVILY